MIEHEYLSAEIYKLAISPNTTRDLTVLIDFSRSPRLSSFSLNTACLFHLRNRSICRSSHWKCTVKKGVLINFTTFTGKHVCQSLFFKKETLAQVLSCKFWETSKNAFFTEHPLATASKSVIWKLFHPLSIEYLLDILSYSYYGNCH